VNASSKLSEVASVAMLSGMESTKSLACPLIYHRSQG
jgi:hypothetical protein